MVAEITSDNAMGQGRAKRRQRRKARAHGEGSVYLEHASGMWVAAVDLGIVNGRRKRKRLRFATQQEARQALTRLRKSLDDGISPGDDRTTVARFLERWLAECVDGPMSDLRPSSRASYSRLVRQHLVPGLGHHPIARLTPLHVQSFLGCKLAAKGDDGAPLLSPRTVQYLHAVLRAALKQAERWGLVARNVAKLVDPPTVKRAEAAVLTTEQAGRLLAHVEGDRLRALYVVAVAMGLRRGELCGLRWEHVDLERGILRVREQLQRLPHKRDESGAVVERRGLTVQALKTDKSRRTLKIPAVVLDELRAHARAQKADRLKAGPLWTETGYLFTTATGAPLDGEGLHKRWKRALKGAGLPAVPFHATRHTAASFLLAQGADLRTVMGQLGHSQIALTADTYAHMLEELHEQTAAKADAALRAAMKAGNAPSRG